MSQPWTVPPVEPKPVSSNVERDTLLLAWRTARLNLAAAKETEMAKRKELTDLLFPNPTKGTQRVELGNGWFIKLVHKLNYSLDKDKTEAALDAIENTGKDAAEKAVNAMIAERLVKFTPELSLTEYKLLPDNIKRIIDDVITVKPAAPELDIEEPKAK